MGHLAIAGAPGITGTPINKDPNCVVNINDPFEPRVRMQYGPDAGACINSILRRSAMQLAPAVAAKYFVPIADTIVVANVSHKNKFWVARIPVKAITKMVLQSEHFPMISTPVKIDIDHTQIRFDFSRPIYLVTQESNTPRKMIKLKNLILSVENIGPKGEAFNFIGGARGHFNLAYRLVSLEDKFNWMVTENQDIVSQKNFLLNKKQQTSVLLEGIRRGTQYGSSRSYDSFSRNCSTELLDLFNTLFKTKKFPVTGFVSNTLPEKLQSMGILSTKEMPDFNDEYWDLQ